MVVSEAVEDTLMTWVVEVLWMMIMTVWAQMDPWVEMGPWAEGVPEGLEAEIGMNRWAEEEGEECLEEEG